MKLVHAKSARAQAAAAAEDALLQAIAGRPGLIAQPAPKTFGAALFAKVRTMNSEKAIEIEGTIMHVLPGTMFRVALANKHLVLAHISGKMRKRFIRLTIGDRVKMEMSPYDLNKARIVWRIGWMAVPSSGTARIVPPRIVTLIFLRIDMVTSPL